MLSLFKRKKIQASLEKNAAQEKLAKSIVSTFIRFQQRWADVIQQHTERLSRNAKLIILSLFCLTAGSISIYFIASSTTSHRASSFTVFHLKKPPYALKSGDENAKALAIITKNEYKKITRFRFYMDSLARSPTGKQLYVSIISQRPGLMDSILLVENIYQTQNKK